MCVPSPSLSREHKENLGKTSQNNLMYDRRVSRGSTYAPSKRTVPLNGAAQFRPIAMAQKQQQAAHQYSANGRKETSHPLPPTSAGGQQQLQEYGSGTSEVDFIRIATPEPVAGRQHTTVQTDTYLEDLRRNRHAQEHDFATQTDPENDRPTQPLFIPRSSGDDVATEIEPDALFDFELEVQAILGVLVEKSLEQALMEVCEEEEMAELVHHQAVYQQEKDAQLVGVQQYIQRDERRKDERARRAAQEAERLAQEKATRERRAAATMAKKMVETMEEEILKKLQAQGAFYDPVRKEVETLFLPHLLAQTAGRLQSHAQAQQLMEEMLRGEMDRYRQRVDEKIEREEEQEVADLVQHKLSPATVPRPVPSILSRVTRAGRSEERTARKAAHGIDEASSAKPSPEERAQALVDGILAERTAKAAAEAQRLKDIVAIQSLQRGKAARARVEKLAAKRRKEAERAAMSPQELLASLTNDTGFTVRLAAATPTDDNTTAAESTQAAAAASSSSSSSSPSLLLVSSLTRFGPASQAGLALGDAILAVNGIPVQAAIDVAGATWKLPPHSAHPGDVVTLQVRRALDGREEAIALELATDEEGFTQQQIRELREEAELPASTLAYMTPEDALAALEKLPGKLGASAGEPAPGLTAATKVTKIGEESAAKRAGLKEGDLIISIDGVPVADPKALTSRCKELLAGDVLELEVVLSPAAEKIQAGAATFSRKTMPTRKVRVEMAGGGKKATVEQIRGWRRIAGLDVFGEDQ